MCGIRYYSTLDLTEYRSSVTVETANSFTLYTTTELDKARLIGLRPRGKHTELARTR